MLSNAYFLAKIRFDTAENEPAKNLQHFAKKKLLMLLTYYLVGAGPRPCAGRAGRRGGGGAGLRRGGAGPLLHGALQHLLQERLPQAHGGAPAVFPPLPAS